MFKEFPKIPRLSKDCVITEKLDGTNACVVVVDTRVDKFDETPIAQVDHISLYAQSRSRMINPENDNFGFAKFVRDNWSDLATLPPGYHFGEWWGPGIQRGYGLKEKRFSLFHCAFEPPPCVSVVPKLYEGPFSTEVVDRTLAELGASGSIASPGFMRPEGIIIYHKASGQRYKKTFDGDQK